MEIQLEKVTEDELDKMELHDVIVVTMQPFFRIMRVYGGWLYNFYDTDKDDYKSEWIYVPIKLQLYGSAVDNLIKKQ